MLYGTPASELRALNRMKEKEARALRPLEETAQSCKRALARWLLLWPVILLGAVSWGICTVTDMLRYVDFVKQRDNPEELEVLVPWSEQVIYGCFITVEALALVLVLYPLVAINYLAFKIDSKLTTALGRRFLKKLERPAIRLRTDEIFHYEFDCSVVTALNSINCMCSTSCRLSRF